MSPSLSIIRPTYNRIASLSSICDGLYHPIVVDFTVTVLSYVYYTNSKSGASCQNRTDALSLRKIYAAIITKEALILIRKES